MLTEGAKFHDFMFTEGRADAIVQARSTARAKGITLWDALAQAGRPDLFMEACRVLRIYDRFKGERALCDYVDVLVEYVESEAAPSLAHHGVKVVFVDEAQDLSPLQWRIVEKMVRGVDQVIIAGDDDQSIYDFIGADPVAFNHYPADEIIVLHQSWRVPQAVGRRAERLIKTVKDRYPKEINWRDEQGAFIYANDRNHNFLPFREGKSAFILCRHQNQVKAISADLTRPHIVNGESHVTGPLAQVYEAHWRLYAGEDVNSELVRKLCRYLKIKFSANGRATISLADMPEEMPEVLTGNTPDDGNTFTKLASYVDRYGIDVLTRAPAIEIMTMHAAKGKEADDVFILPDVYDTVYKNRNEDHEKRVLYVALTRARERVIVMPSTTNRYYTELYS